MIKQSVAVELEGPLHQSRWYQVTKLNCEAPGDMSLGGLTW